MKILSQSNAAEIRWLRSLFALLTIVAFLGTQQAALAANEIWNGAGSDNNWSTAANWVGGVTPVDMDSVSFDGLTRLNNANDLTSLITSGITFNNNAGAFTLSGSNIALNGDLVNNSSNLQTLKLPLQLNADAGGLFSAVYVNKDGGDIAISGSMSWNPTNGSRLLLQGNGGTLTLSGDNTFTNEIAVGNRSLVVNAIGGEDTCAGTLKLDFSASGAPATNILGGGGILGPITLSGGTLVIQGADNTNNVQSASSWRTDDSFNNIQLIPGANGSLTLNLGDHMDSINGNGRRYGSVNFIVPPGATLTTTWPNKTTKQGCLESDTDGCANYILNSTDWAMNDGSGNIVPFNNYSTDGTNSGNKMLDVLGNMRLGCNPATLRFNQTMDITFTGSGILGASSQAGGNGILVTPNVGNHNIVMTNGTITVGRFAMLNVFNFNTNGFLEIDDVIAPNSGADQIHYVGPGRTVLSGNNTYSGGSIQIDNGGTLSINQNANIGAPATGCPININSGTLEARATILLANGGANARDIYLNHLGGTITVTGTNTLTVPGVVHGSQGGLTKDGSGNLVLSGVNTYSGSTLVKAGKLVLSTAQTGAGAITVSGGAALGINVTSGVLQPVALSLGDGNGATIEFSALMSATTAPVNTATLNPSGTTTVNIISASTSVGVGQYPLITCASDVGSGGFQIGSLPLGFVANIVTNTTATNLTIALNVTVAPATKTWTGANDGNWDFTTANWASGGPTVFLDGDYAQFDDTATLNTVNLAANVSPGAVIVTNNTKSYTFTGTNQIIGVGGLLKLGSGSLILAATDASSTAATVNGGTLVIGDGDTNGAIVPPIVNNAAVVFNRADTVSYSAGISGSGSVTQNGVASGVLALGGPLTYTGDTVIQSGTLKCLGQLPSGAGRGNVIVQPAGLLDLNGNGVAIDGLSGSGTVDSLAAGATLTVGNNNATSTFAGSISNSANINANSTAGTLNLTKTGTGTLFITGTNYARGQINFSGGVLNVASMSDYGDAGTPNSGPSALANRNFTQEGSTIGLLLSGGTLQYTGSTPQTTDRMLQFQASQTSSFDASGSNPNATVEFTWDDGSANFWSGGGTRTLRFTGSNTGANVFTVHIEDNANNFTSVIKDGPGTWYLTNSVAGQSPLGAIDSNGNSYRGATTVSNGVLYVSSGSGDVVVHAPVLSAGPPVGTVGGGNYNVMSGATLGAINLNNGYRVRGQTLTLQPGTTMRFANVSSTVFPVCYFTNVVAGSGNCTIVLDDTNNLVAGNTYPLIQYGTLSGYIHSLVALPPGLYGQLTNDTANSWIALNVASTPFINPTPTNITVQVIPGVGGGQSLDLEWPQDHIGWILEAKTNALNLGNWFPVVGSDATNEIIVPINPTNGSVFYRLVY